MKQIVYDCPYCKSKNMTFDIIVDNHDNEFQALYALKYEHEIDPETAFYSMTFHYYALCQCRKITCQQTVPFILECQANVIKIIDILRPPANLSYKCPEHVPENIKEKFNEAAQCYAYDCFIASAAMLRLCIEITTKDLLIDNKDKEQKLHKRIEILCNQGLIRQRLKEFATEIRFEGNDAVHEGCIDQDNLEATFEFTTFFLQELYTDKKEMELVKERRAQRKELGTTK